MTCSRSHRARIQLSKNPSVKHATADHIVNKCMLASPCTFHSPLKKKKKSYCVFSIKSLDLLVPPVGKLPQLVICFSAELFRPILREKVISVITVSSVLGDGKMHNRKSGALNSSPGFISN